MLNLYIITKCTCLKIVLWVSLCFSRFRTPFGGESRGHGTGGTSPSLWGVLGQGTGRRDSADGSTVGCVGNRAPAGLWVGGLAGRLLAQEAPQVTPCPPCHGRTSQRTSSLHSQTREPRGQAGSEQALSALQNVWCTCHKMRKPLLQAVSQTRSRTYPCYH